MPLHQLDLTVSPEVLPDGRVVFRLRAPKATRVALEGDFMPAAQMQREADGLWSITAGPIEPGSHEYVFAVDGVCMPDPFNPWVKVGLRGSGSIVHVPSRPPAPWDLQEVTPGSVEISLHRSRLLGGRLQPVYAYLPPGYERSSAARYPVLYLLHGTGDTASTWIEVGRANIILDNLLAQDKAMPMIVIMPFGHVVPYFGQPYDYPANTAAFEQYLLTEVMPFAEAKYRVAPGPENRAIAGLSMGGSQAISTGLGHLDDFGWIGGFSYGGWPDITDRHKSILANPERTNAKLRLFWIGHSSEDEIVPFGQAQDFADALKRSGIRLTFRFRHGTHVWSVWQWCLAEFAPLLFRS